MIKIENEDVYGFEAAVRGMRNPFNSHKKSDSEKCELLDDCDDCVFRPCQYEINSELFSIGVNDFELMKYLVGSGTDHSKFMRMINMTCDITAPLYWWKEFDTYKVGTVRNSCSTMHTIADKEFTLEDFSHEHLIDDAVNTLENIIMLLNECREAYLSFDKHIENGDFDVCIRNKKDVWWQMIQLLPSSYNQRATVQMNYAVLRNMYHARKNHKLDEWREFCRWVETLPYSELITIGKDNKDER